MRYEVRVGARRQWIETDPTSAAARMLVDGRAIAYDISEIVPGRLWSILIDGRAHEVAHLGGDPPRMWVDGREVRVAVSDERALAARRGPSRGGAGRYEVRAPMPGLLKAVHVREGDVVDRDSALATLEAMKMENELRAPARSRVQRLVLSAGSKVEGGALIAVLIEET
jgi:biotin carboxyl carrier protein